ncbi:esterase/lipase family protein [Acetobacter fallax]|uniref:Alpha/beta fold hydrolase n=1 Tax=Acetobacter fallax TaxID=1737473 RepID=A0ABX0KGA0_9PROT|nr:alpha/beta fold hydrolase [Acetobacter fallax]NHO34018.1 alpha/beta fold hydrolase [Acetobacter fallax]NHO37552.1 alpha/beta fold hydrolase [Acetobacter fallax]
MTFFHSSISLRICVAASVMAFSLSGCTPPVSVHHLGLTRAYLDETRSALAGRVLSNATQIVLERQNLRQLWQAHPAAAIAALRGITAADTVGPDVGDRLFALAELNYLRGRQTHFRADFMAAALYAYAYLAPGEAQAIRPSPYDPRFRQACDIYMLGLTEALGSPVQITPQSWQLPFGSLDINAGTPSLNWHGHPLTDLRPTARLSVDGVKNVYRHPGLGEPLAALPELSDAEDRSFQIADKLRIPVNLLVEFDDPRRQIFSDHLNARFIVSAIDVEDHRIIGDDSVPLHYEPTAARAISLQDSVDWSAEYRGFLDGSLFLDGHSPRLVAIQPHQYGHMPVVLVHGTASSPARWADMINDLLEDPVIRKHFEFWLFSYGTGNPIPYSALELRRSIQQAVNQLGGTQADPALGQITLIGHSQGGLLAKMLVIQAGNRLWNGVTKHPLASLDFSPRTRHLLEEAMFPTPVPEVHRVVFISTPQHGSYLAGYSVARLVGRFVSFPVTVTDIIQQVVTGDVASSRTNMQPWRAGSVYGMSPDSPFIKALAAIPVSPTVHAHSIIPVLGDGPLKNADDGVVSYESAHIPDVDSELVVRHSGHSTQSDPITIAEVRRILLEQIGSAGDLSARYEKNMYESLVGSQSNEAPRSASGHSRTATKALNG